MRNGFINLYKEPAMTSNKAISILKRVLKENNIDTKVGHFGTLDPLAEGVLPVALGRATRLFDDFLQHSKTYVATFLFGTCTDTLDIDGKILQQEDIIINESDILAIIDKFVGKFAQIPPQYSAKSVDGVRAYKLARQGIEVELKPKDIEIYSCKLNKKVDKNTFEFTICCSSGTYVRSIVRDMAKEMNTIGIMTKLVRTQSGSFDLESAVKMDKLDNISQKVLPMELLTDNFEKLNISFMQKERLLNGVYPIIDNLEDKNYSVYCEGTLIGIGQKFDKSMLKIRTWLL